MSVSIAIGFEINEGYEIASKAFKSREEAEKALQNGNWYTHIYRIRFAIYIGCYKGDWYIMAKRM